MYHSFFIYSSVDGHLGCFHVLAIVNSAAMNIGVHVSFRTTLFFGYVPKSGILDHMIALFLIFKGPSILSSIEAVPIYISTNSARGFPFLHTLSSCDPAIPLLGIYPEKTIIQKDTCTPMFIAALFTIARTWKQSKCPSTDESIKKMW